MEHFKIYIIELFTLSRKCYFLTVLLSITIASCTKDDSQVPEIIDLSDDVVTSDDGPSSADLNVVFARTYGGSQTDTFQDVLATSDGGFAALGYTQSVDGDVTDNPQQINSYWMIKTDSNGEIQWSKTLGGDSDDRGQRIIQTSDGGYALAGYSQSSTGDVSENNGFYDHWIVKLDNTGSIEWEKSFGYPGSDQALSIIQTSDGGYFTSGFLDVTASGGEGNDGLQQTVETNTRSALHGVGEFWGHKLDANGNLEWRRFFGGSNNDRGYDVIQAPDDGILMVGASESNDFDISNSKGSYDFWVVRINNEGDLLWEKSFGGSQIDIAYGVAATPDGGYILAGDTRSSDGDVNTLKGNADVWLVKINDNGDLIWERTLGGTNFESARAITSIPGGYAITGGSRSTDGDVTINNGQNDIWIATVDLSGTITGEISVGGNDQDFGYGIAANTEGTIIVAGDTESTNGLLTTSNGATDAVLIKIE